MDSIPFASVTPPPPGRPTIAIWPLAVAWGTFVFVPLVGIGVGALHVLFSLFARRRGVLIALALSPLAVLPSFGFLSATAGYFQGTATFLMAGHPVVEAENLDPAFRCFNRSSGCMIHGWEPFVHSGNNAALRGLIRCFGPMNGSYVGKYPTRDEAFGALDKSKDSVTFDHIDTAKFAGEIGVAPPANPSRWLFWLAYIRFEEALRFAPANDEVVAVGNNEYAVLIVKKTGQAIGIYYRRPAEERPAK